MSRVEIELQPKQDDLLNLIESSPARVIGLGGGRGCGKSSGLDRIAIALSYAQRDLLGCVVMRNWDQVLKYHIEPIRRDFPWLESAVKITSPAKLRIGRSEIDFSYAENYDDVERRFRSANYRYIWIDQAEQFSEREIREIRKACRSRGSQTAKLILSFNMRGAGIQTFRKWFYLREFPKDENPDDYVFLKVNPWDNVEWVRTALAADKLTERDYYRWTDEQRMRYAAERGDYTRQLATDDEVLRKADWYGDWDSLEGAYFANSFDLDAVRITPRVATELKKPWSVSWIAQDWGKAHYCATYWNFRVTLSPAEAKSALGWEIPYAINVVVTEREMILNELTSTEIARRIIDATPKEERERHRAYFLSPDAFGERDSINTIASQQTKELRAVGLPAATRADNDRIGGWALMAKLLLAAKHRGIDPETRRPFADAWLISSNCAELLRTIPTLLRDPKNLDDVLKTDKGQAKIEQDVADAIRYALKSMLAPRKKSEEDIFRERMNEATPTARMMLNFRHIQQQEAKRRAVAPPSWRRNL